MAGQPVKRPALAPGAAMIRIFVALNCHLWQSLAMEFAALLRVVADEPLFETGLLLAGDVDPADVRRQLSRWVNAGKILQLRRGLYVLAPPYRRRTPHPFLLSNRLVRPSYVSLQSALAFHGHIPEAVAVTTGVTTRRPGRHSTPLGEHDLRHVKRELLFGHATTEVAPRQHAFVARPEKALLDLVYLTPGGDRRAYLEGLRLQALGELDLDRLDAYAARWGGAKIARAAGIVRELTDIEREEYEEL